MTKKGSSMIQLPEGVCQLVRENRLRERQEGGNPLEATMQPVEGKIRAKSIRGNNLQKTGKLLPLGRDFKKSLSGCKAPEKPLGYCHLEYSYRNKISPTGRCSLTSEGTAF